MSEHILLQLAGVLILGIAMQWFAWRLRLPAILMLLGAGLLLGPGSALLARYGLLHGPLLEPDKLFGQLLLPAVSLAVALILFEGGLTLNLREHKASRGVIWALVTCGAAITFAVAALAAFALLGLNWRLSVLLGAILFVTGPTVIGPLLRHVRPGGKVGSILKWEGIIIDPIGAMIAIVVFEALTTEQVAALPILKMVVSIIFVGAACGAAGAGLIVLLFRRHWVPDFLHNSFVLVMVLMTFAGANALQHESGLFATTLMGLVLANQRRVNVHHVMEFKESVTILLISALFIVLGARLTLHQLGTVPWGGMVLFLAVLIVVGRPLAVLVSTSFSSLTWAERKFLAVLAPRGIVAAAVASVFALRLDHEHFEQAEMLVPITFTTIIGTVTFYGLTASWFARKLGLSHVGSHGFLIAGAGHVERTLAAALQAEGQPVLMVDTNRENIAAARLQGVQVLLGSVLSQYVMDETQLMPIGRFLALTSNDEVNALATMRYQRVFSRSEVYQLAPVPRTTARQETVSGEMQGRVLFSSEITYGMLEQRIENGHVIKKTPLTAEFSYEEFKKTNDPEVIPLFVHTALGELQLFTAEFPPKPKPGDSLYTLAPPKRPAAAV
jgi:NhaP-type Na+/H+ or K+/H+ antiporter